MENIRKSLKKAYSILKFTDEEADNALNDLMEIQQVAVANELLKTLTKEEADRIEAMEQETDENKRIFMESIAKAHAGNKEFKEAAQAVVKKVINDHVTYLKTRGDDFQKSQIAAILAEVG